MVQIYKKQVAYNNSTIDELKKIRTPTSGKFLVGSSVGFCAPGCKECWDIQNCVVCLPWYALDLNLICARCSPLCKTCSISDLSTCLTVVDGYYKDADGKAQKCHDSCETCNGAGPSACNSCKVSFALDRGVCLPCQ
jgi:hypothetical protein